MPPNRFPARLPARAATGVAAVGLAGTALTGYAFVEARSFVVRRVDLPVLPAGARPIRVLHLSDLHLTPTQHRKRRWLAGLAALTPDLVVNTGDNLAHQASVGPLVEDLGGLLDVPGVFVFGSNDYFSPTFRNPVGYLLPDRGKRHTRTPKLPFEELRGAFTGAGWLDLDNATGSLEVNGTRLDFAGVDDPHLRYDDLDVIDRLPRTPGAVRIGVAHAPYLRVLDRFAAAAYDVVLAGHTHGGQVCLPIRGALVTNCDLEPARAKGLHRHPADSAPADRYSSWLHVSAGAGTSPYVALRVCCRPEATLLTLRSRLR